MFNLSEQFLKVYITLYYWELLIYRLDSTIMGQSYPWCIKALILLLLLSLLLLLLSDYNPNQEFSIVASLFPHLWDVWSTIILLNIMTLSSCIHLNHRVGGTNSFKQTIPVKFKEAHVFSDSWTILCSIWLVLLHPPMPRRINSYKKKYEQYDNNEGGGVS